MHSHCAHFTVNVAKNLHMQTCGVWMAAWLEHAECQLQAVDQVFFAVVDSRFQPGHGLSHIVFEK